MARPLQLEQLASDSLSQCLANVDTLRELGRLNCISFFRRGEGKDSFLAALVLRGNLRGYVTPDTDSVQELLRCAWCSSLRRLMAPSHSALALISDFGQVQTWGIEFFDLEHSYLDTAPGLLGQGRAIAAAAG